MLNFRGKKSLYRGNSNNKSTDVCNQEITTSFIRIEANFRGPICPFSVMARCYGSRANDIRRDDVQPNMYGSQKIDTTTTVALT